MTDEWTQKPAGKSDSDNGRRKLLQRDFRNRRYLSTIGYCAVADRTAARHWISHGVG